MGILSGIWTYIVAGVVSLAIGAYGGYRWELGAYNNLKAADAKSLVMAMQKAAKTQAAEDKVNLNAAVAEARAQQKIITQTQIITQTVTKYVHDTISCPGLTVGLARVMRAAAAGIDPASLDLAPGQSDDFCSDIAPSEVAGWFTAYAGASKANAEQLNALEANILAKTAAAK